ncbi:threonine/homoserine/homoserine lactone efflux protein [Sulfitobacter undariae]|uniref:Threonine/homoserine/homoserine lactone efflux protein n=1 Tax=Sulfitobacter undariae TaxID=1563671 RepID=A0A7W6E0L8_9RHOB|nr:LysE family translocator [Sulfitobacter undariae]MBB3992541.1 threonine/homoserine/homoserine lactone efflux protein [Sulfitobacter undariae]
MIQKTIALLLFLFPLAYSPGPGNMFFAANSARFGFRATVPANIGYHVATWIVTAAIGFGFMAALEQFPQVFTVLKVAGSLYVLWIAWKMFRAGTLDGNEAAKAATFTDGVILLVLNPKAYVIIALMFTQFLDQSEMGTLAAVVLITTVFTLNNLIVFSLWAFVGDRISGYFRTPESAQKLNVMFGGILAAVALWMLLS